MDEITRDTLIVKYNQGSLSREENQQLLEWIKLNAEHQQHFDDTQKVWQKSQDPAAEIDFNTEQEWVKLTNHIQPLPIQKNPEKDAPAKVKYLKPWLWGSLAAAVALFLVAYIVLFQGTSVQDENKFVSKSSGNNGKHQYRLPDGSVVWLNENSTIRYPEKFDPRRREVYLTGEAFFEVAKDPSKPFIIHGNRTIIQVLGTSFNLKSKPDEEIVEVTVVSGKVRFSKEDISAQNLILTAGMKGFYHTKLDTVYQTINNDLNFRAWQDNRLVFNNLQLKEVIIILKKHYKTSIKPANQAILECRFTSTFKQAQLEEILQAITLSLDLHFHYEDNKYILSGNGC
jgi:ferric-dicitrate binding protein FerR (iron transport regulator)